MKRINYLLIIAVVFLGATVLLSGCKKKSDAVTPSVTTVKGTASFIAGVSGDLNNAKASLYTGIAEWNANNPVKSVAVTGSGASVSFVITGILPGTYYLDVWKDIDNSAGWSVGDFVGWYGLGSLGSPDLQPFQISDGGTFSTNITMYILAK